MWLSLNTVIKFKLHTTVLSKAYIKMMYIFPNVNYAFLFPLHIFFLYASKWNALKLCNRYARQWSGGQFLLCANRHWKVTGGVSVNSAIVMPCFGFISLYFSCVLFGAWYFTICLIIAAAGSVNQLISSVRFPTKTQVILWTARIFLTVPSAAELWWKRPSMNVIEKI